MGSSAPSCAPALPSCCLWCLSAPTLTHLAHRAGTKLTWRQKEKIGSCQQSQGNSSHSKGGLRPGGWQGRDAAMPFWYLMALGWAQLSAEAYVKPRRRHRWGPWGQNSREAALLLQGWSPSFPQGQRGLEGSGYLHLLISDMV